MALRSIAERNAVILGVHMDKELILLNAVQNRPEMSQRELANKTGLSLGSINILLKKMIREGLIKLEKLPPDRAAYMLTAKGLEEKITKTKAYIQGHYAALEHMRSQLKRMFNEDRFHDRTVILLIEQKELYELAKQVAERVGIKLSLQLHSTSEDVMIVSDTLNHAFEGSYEDWVNVHDYLNL